MAAPTSYASWMLNQEARALLTRLERIKSFAMSETMVPAAALTVEAQAAIEKYLQRGRAELREHVERFLEWLRSPEGLDAPPSEAQRRYTFIRLRFNVVLSQFDIFSEAMSQRSEVDNGIWLAGLDIAAKDALALPGLYEAPPVICYLARGPGAAIRRARTRLPGGGENPVAIVRIPRERMVGASIASSLVHEVGHQGAALLGLVSSLQAELREVISEAGDGAPAWRLWSRWISEIIADFWAVARVGVASTVGLIGIVSLPKPFVFRLNVDDPHPMPWVRVKLSAAIGDALFPHPQWGRLSRLWDELYPREDLAPAIRTVIDALEATLPRMVRLLVEHRPESLRGQTLPRVMRTEERHPSRLGALYQAWRSRRQKVRSAPPTLAFAALGQARNDGALAPEEESDALADLLKHWALASTIDTSEICAPLTQSRPWTPRPSGPALLRSSIN